MKKAKKKILPVILSALAVIALTMTPALAKNAKKPSSYSSAAAAASSASTPPTTPSCSGTITTK